MTTSIKFRGVSYHVGHGTWRAKIKTQGRHIHLGCFTRQHDAAWAWDCAARLLGRPTRKLNFPDREPTPGTGIGTIRRILIAKGVLE